MDENKQTEDTSTLETSIEEDGQSEAVSATQQVDFLVKQLSADLDKLQEKIKEQRQMVKDAMQTDSRYQDLSEKIKDLNKQRMAIQKELAAQDSVRAAKEELEDLNSEKKAMMHKLSEYLKQYIDAFGSRTLEDLEGNLKQIVTQYKLVRQKSD